MQVTTAGATGWNEGSITLRHTTTTTNIFSVMPIDKNQTAIAATTVPAGKTLYINKLKFQMSRASGAAGSANVSLRSRPLGEVYQANPSPEITDGHDYESSQYYVFSEKTDVKGRVESVSDNNTIVTAQFSGYLIDN